MKANIDRVFKNEDNENLTEKEAKTIYAQLHTKQFKNHTNVLFFMYQTGNNPPKFGKRLCRSGYCLILAIGKDSQRLIPQGL